MNERPLIEAHRGDSSTYPENTLSAFRGAVLSGADSIELDTHLSADGVWVVMHDVTLERTTDGTGDIRALPYSAIACLDAGRWKSPRFAGERVPTLDDALRLARDSGVPLNVELKTSSVGREHGRAFGTFLRQTGLQNAVAVVSSFDEEILLGVRQTAPECALGMLGSDREALEKATTHAMEWVHLQYRAATPECVAAAHAAGIRVMVWTVDTPDSAARYAELGVDRICTNRPADMVEARRVWRRGECPDGCCRRGAAGPQMQRRA